MEDDRTPSRSPADRTRTLQKLAMQPSQRPVFAAVVDAMDQSIHRVLDHLDKNDLADNTIIVLWSDHGFQLGEKGRWGKYSLWERATRVNLMWVVPDVTTPGTKSARPVNLLDIYPTLASLTGCKPPEGQLEGDRDPGRV